jgi:N-acetylmuramoyl-L-alanine amidase
MQEEYLDQSIQLASLVQKNLIHEVKGKDRGVKQQRFVVLYQTYMPSILVESGFLSSPLDFKYMSTRAGQSKVSKAIAEGIKKYVHQLELNTVSGNEALASNQTPAAEINNTNNDIYENVKFKVQIASGSRKLENKSYNFKGLKNVERAKVGRSYKYYIGNTSNYKAIQQTLKVAKSSGFSSAFIVAFIDGKKVDVTEVLKKS